LIDFDRRTFDSNLRDEYPFAEFISLKDKDIIGDRLHPHEVVDNTVEMRKKMEKINQEYLDKISKDQ
jgi:hypothetical protein